MNKLQSESGSDRLYGTRTDGVFSVSGVVHVIRNEAELPYVREGEIIVAHRIDPAWKDQLALAKAIVEDSGASGSYEKRAPDSPLRVSVPAAVSARKGHGIITGQNVVPFSSAKPKPAENDDSDDQDMASRPPACDK